jgi:biotin carboxyl carrier protein
MENDKKKDSELQNGKKDKPEIPVPLDLEKIDFKGILSYIETTDLDFVQIEKDGKKIVLRRTNASIKSKAAPVQEAPKEKEEPEAPQIFSIRSPIVGRFHSSMGSDRPPLIVEGGKVTAGQKVSIVEAMKIKKDVISAYTGKVTRILVRDGDPVEYGQELFTVEPEKEGESA